MDPSLFGDACSFLSTNSATECPMRRPCRECLVQPGCMIDTMGACVSNATVTSEKNFRQAFTRGLTLPAARANNSLALGEQQDWEFPAFEATYCPSDDAVCAKCIEEEFWYTSGDSRFCVGAGGCICIHHCEVFPLQGPPCVSIPNVAPTPTPTTPASTPSPTKSSYLEPDSTEWWEYKTRQIFIGVAVFAVLLLLACWGVCRVSRKHRAPRSTAGNAAITVIDDDNGNGATHNKQEKSSGAYREMQA